MSATSRLDDALSQYLRQCNIQWQDARYLQTLCWMMIGMIESQNVHLNGFGVYVKSRAQPNPPTTVSPLVVESED